MIDVYLENSRKILGQPQKERLLFGKYGVVCSIISSKFDWFVPPELVVVRSQNRFCEISTINETEFLIYDEYLSYTFDVLNRLLYNSQNDIERYSYLKKIIAEYLNLSRMDNLALSYAISSKMDLGNSRSYLEDRDRIRRMEISNIAEIFALSHELGHSFLQQYKGRSAALKKTRDKALAVFDIKLPSRTYNTEEERDKVIFEVIQTLYPINPESHTEIFRSIKDKDQYLSDISKEIDQYRQKAEDLVARDESLVEEMYCDRFAAFITFQFFHDILDEHLVEVVEGIYLAFLNMRLLLLIRAKISRQQNNDVIMLSQQARHGDFRIYLNVLTRYFKCDPIDRGIGIRHLALVNKIHSGRINDLFIVDMMETLEEVIRDNESSLKSTEKLDVDYFLNQVRFV